MLHRKLVGIAVLALFSAVTLAAQVKEMPRTPIKPINEPKIVDINSGTETDFVNLGLDRTVAKKIVDGRPYRSKRDLVSRQVLTTEQYEKFKASLIARRPGGTTKKKS